MNVQIDKSIRFICTLIIVLTTLLLVSGVVRGEATAPLGPTRQIGMPVHPPCLVPAHKYNKAVVKLNTIKGKNVRRKVNRPMRCFKLKKLKARVRLARADCVSKTYGPVDIHGNGHATASHYGRGDGFTGGPLACGGHLYVGQIGTAHKTLPCGTIVYFRDSKGNGVRVPVIDRGPYAGGRTWDLTSWTADRLGVGGVSTVTSAQHNCWAK